MQKLLSHTKEAMTKVRESSKYNSLRKRVNMISMPLNSGTFRERLRWEKGEVIQLMEMLEG